MYRWLRAFCPLRLASSHWGCGLHSGDAGQRGYRSAKHRRPRFHRSTKSTGCISSTSLWPMFRTTMQSAWRKRSRASSRDFACSHWKCMISFSPSWYGTPQLDDAKFLARTGQLNETVLKQRYEKELRPYLANEQRHDLTLKLEWTPILRQPVHR